MKHTLSVYTHSPLIMSRMSSSIYVIWICYLLSLIYSSVQSATTIRTAVEQNTPSTGCPYNICGNGAECVNGTCVCLPGFEYLRTIFDGSRHVTNCVGIGTTCGGDICGEWTVCRNGGCTCLNKGSPNRNNRWVDCSGQTTEPDYYTKRRQEFEDWDNTNNGVPDDIIAWSPPPIVEEEPEWITHFTDNDGVRANRWNHVEKKTREWMPNFKDNDIPSSTYDLSDLAILDQYKMEYHPLDDHKERPQDYEQVMYDWKVPVGITGGGLLFTVILIFIRLNADGRNNSNEKKSGNISRPGDKTSLTKSDSLIYII